MTLTQNFVVQARYNAWMNRKLYAVCATIPATERTRDLGAFFRSIHGTLSHQLLVDHVWIGRWAGSPPAYHRLDQIVHEDFADLHTAQLASDAHLLARVSRLDTAALTRRIAYTSLLDRQARELDLATLLTHLFLHQTHHRGQLTTLIAQLGYDFGETDLIRMADTN